MSARFQKRESQTSQHLIEILSSRQNTLLKSSNLGNNPEPPAWPTKLIKNCIKTVKELVLLYFIPISSQSWHSDKQRGYPRTHGFYGGNRELEVDLQLPQHFEMLLKKPTPISPHRKHKGDSVARPSGVR